jgi:DNA-directed RNA polymerase I and III subunit RPAC2
VCCGVTHLLILILTNSTWSLDAEEVGWDTADLHQLAGHEPDYSACTFCLANEDHTLGNALRWIIMKE